jgi:NAD(P)H-flavin reductase
MLITITICLIAPWLNLRRVPVTAERLSDHAIRLYFTYAIPRLCSGPALAIRPWLDFHKFASIPDERGFSIIVSKAGDWTSKVITDPPTHLWKRGWMTRGVLNVAPIFKGMVIVTTGSGIGPVMSLLNAGRNLNVRLLWSTRDPLKTYGQSIIDDAYRADPNAVIINTSTNKRPELAELAYDLYLESKSEAVFLISNPKVTRKFVYSLESRGVPTFAPIFDS